MCDPPPGGEGVGTEGRGDQPLPLSSQPNDLSIDEGAGPTAGATHPLPVSTLQLQVHACTCTFT